jgi:preprotein translocase subunit SecY
MARPGAAGIAGGLGDLGKLTELRQRILFVLGAILVFRIGSFIPLPGIDPHVLAQLVDQQRGTILDMFNMFSGGALERLSLFALGIMPYISASIIMQLLSYTVPTLEQIKKEGEAGRRKITQYTRYGTVVLATFQAIGISTALQGQQMGGAPLVILQGMPFVISAVICLVTGTLFLMWLGEQVTERGVGNGISIIIFAGIVAGLPSAIGGSLELVRTGELNTLSVLFLFALAIAVTAFVVFVERGQRRITVNYAKRQQGRKLYAAQSTHLPLKLNMAGVIPPIFASSIILFPATAGQWFGSTEGMGWLKDISTMLSPGQPLYIMFYAMAIIFFCFFYTGCLHSGYPSGRADGAFYRRRDDPPDPGRRHLHHRRVSAARVPDSVLERAVLLRWYVPADYRGRGDGLHGSGPVSYDVSSVREFDEEGQSEESRPGRRAPVSFCIQVKP